MGKLTCQDLMVGDWFEDGYKSSQVTSITCDGIVETTSAISNIDVVEPIELTEDILVKNGFGKVNNQYFFGQVEIKELRDCWVVTINKEDADIDINIHYVHQLQHLLRLVGIEKEIEL